MNFPWPGGRLEAWRCKPILIPPGRGTHPTHRLDLKWTRTRVLNRIRIRMARVVRLPVRNVVGMR